MIRYWLTMLIFTLGSSYASATEHKAERVVVIKRIAGTAHLADGTTNTLYPPDIVEVIERQKNKVLVQRSHGENKAVWVPLDTIATTSAFHPMTAWHGQRQFTVSSEDYDSSMTYTLKPDATFTAVYKNVGEPNSYSKGHLYENGRVIWAQMPGPNASTLYRWSLFWIQDNGKLCYIYDVGVCGSDE